jgi:CheY-like chemotaxis protein
MIYNEFKMSAEKSGILRSEFSANMSHEVRTPLNGILGLAQVLLKSEEIEPKIRNDIKMIVESGTSLLALIEDIMDVSRIEAGQMKIKYKPFFLNNLMDQLYSMFLANPLYKMRNAGQKKIELKYDKPAENVTIMSDPDRLQQIFVNLIGNALKFTQTGYVHFGYFIKKHDIVFYVKDSGIGIPEEKKETIFDRFIQVDNTLARKFSGSGLGLAISKGFVTLLKGKIWCESELGKGSNFYFTIPYHPTSMLISSDTPQKKSIVKYDWSNYTVLIVEDDTINFKVIEAMLRNTKIQVIHADNGLKSIECVRLYPQIDLVLMDVHLPEMSGLEATENILKINPTLPIIAQTANAMSEDKEKCLEAGCVDYISKPIDMGDLFAKIAKHLPD